MMFCPACNQKNLPGWAFCPHCGEKLPPPQRQSSSNSHENHEVAGELAWQRPVMAALISLSLSILITWVLNSVFHLPILLGGLFLPFIFRPFWQPPTSKK